ncbi:Gamma-secretase subunit Aph-1 [Porphyridium purpureum]|uniref:Gamma-secretase subunit Aph-1 n=1 Tax=Porphyridium purpureum TaxID=35688 RepID=A0A5J4YTJ9_PORPP|nr:Gamma-secretase subunit Aph-1 [Porphyridium purpureum]|eukprot:POR8177..scf227_4
METEQNNPLLVSVGCLFLSLSATLIWGGYVIMPRPHLFIVATMAAFFYCLGQMLAAGWWFAIPPLKQEFAWVLFSTVTIQEGIRWAMFALFNWMKGYGEGVKAFLRVGAVNGLLTGFAVGAGYGLMSVLLSYTSIVGDNYWFDQSIYMPNCPEINFFVAGAAFALAYSIMHMALGVLAWSMYDTKNYVGIFFTYAWHLGISMASIGNTNRGGCVYTLGIVYGLVVLLSLCALAFSIRFVKMSKQVDA